MHIGDMWSEEDSEEPEWVKSEREHFTTYRDLNHDGFMDRDEVQQWIQPPDYDQAKSEAKHLMFESDADKVTSCLVRVILVSKLHMSHR